MIRYESLNTTFGGLVTDWDGNVDHLKEALLTAKVLIFRDCENKPDPKTLGPVFFHPFMPWQQEDGSYKARYNKDWRAHENVWHQDYSWVKDIPGIEMIEFEHGPPVGGDILFADRHAAFNMLDDQTKDMLLHTDFHHRYPYPKKLLQRWMIIRGFDRKTIREKLLEYWSVDNDVQELKVFHKGAAKAVNGEITLDVHTAFVNPYYVDINKICDVYKTPEIQIRWQYQPGDTVMWHNHLVMHYACADYWPQEKKFTRWTYEFKKDNY
jgi:taurine dioxygenase